jgi:hypothetical protein
VQPSGRRVTTARSLVDMPENWWVPEQKNALKPFLSAWASGRAAEAAAHGGQNATTPRTGHGVERWRRLSQGLLLGCAAGAQGPLRLSVPLTELCVRECGADQRPTLAALVYCLPSVCGRRGVAAGRCQPVHGIVGFRTHGAHFMLCCEGLPVAKQSAKRTMMVREVLRPCIPFTKLDAILRWLRAEASRRSMKSSLSVRVAIPTM